MATFKICVFEKHKKANGTYPVSIRVCWKRKYGYIKTEYYASDKQISQKPYYDKNGKKKHTFDLKDTFILNELNSRITNYENLKVKKLGNKIELYTAQQLADFFKKEGSPGTDSTIDFVKFSRLHCQRLIDRGKKTTAATIQRSTNMLIDFCNGRENVSITEIDSKFLIGFENYLRSKRTIKRANQFGRMVTIERPGLSDISVIDYLTDIRTVFNAAIEEYNDEDKDEIKIKHYPFRKFKLKKAAESKKRVLTIEQIRGIRLISDEELIHKRAIIARDVFLLSFYLAGMNLADLYDMDYSCYAGGRLSYFRQKTRDRRRDKAFISIAIPPEALHLLDKYQDKSKEKVFGFYKMYTSSHIFDSNMNLGLKVVAKSCQIEKLTSYYARFSFASIARNDCNVSVDDISQSLNHVDASVKTTEIYLKKDWSKVDNAVRAVLDLLTPKVKKPRTNARSSPPKN